MEPPYHEIRGDHRGRGGDRGGGRDRPSGRARRRPHHAERVQGHRRALSPVKKFWPCTRNDGSTSVHPARGKVLMSTVDRQQAAKAAAFRALHQGEPFVIPNPWDVGSARVLEALGFRALATTSSGFAFTLGRRDGGATLMRWSTTPGRSIRPRSSPCPWTSRTGTAPIRKMPRPRSFGRRRRAPSAARSRTTTAGVPLSAGACRRTDHGRGRGRSDARIPVHAHRPAENHIRGNPDLRDDQPTPGVPGGRRRRPLRSGPPGHRGHPRGVRIRRQTRQRVGAAGTHVRGDVSAGAARESRWLAHVGRAQGVHRRGDRDRPRTGPVGPRREGSAGRVARALVGE